MNVRCPDFFADRMKDKGMSWTIRGSQRMEKAIELTRNGELSNWVVCRPTLDRREDQSLIFDIFSYKEQVAMPAFYGQHAYKPWVRALRELTTLNYLIN